ncbi:MAG: hypothetical protein IJP38_06465 [Oscillospiraceae bacterium]|nr:hypothetical protein [Oscillospiraceae bacterium]
MRKILAIILAVTMLATFAPSAFAAEGEESEIEIVCDLGNILAGLPNTTTSFSQITTASQGVFKYVFSSLTKDTSVKDGVVGEEGADNKGFKYAGVAGKYHLRMFGGVFICFEINVPENGTYSMNVMSQKNQKGQVVNVYATDAETFYNQGTFAIDNLGEKAGSYSAYDKESKLTDIASTGTWESVPVFEEQYLSKGRYVITFHGADGNNEYNGTSLRAPIGTFTLKGTPIEEEPEEKAITYNVAKVMRDNEIFYVKGQSGQLEAERMTYEMTNGLFEVMDARGSVTIGGNGATLHNFLKLAQNATVDFKVNIPEDGKYFLNANHQIAKEGAPVTVFVDGEIVGSYDCYSDKEGTPDKFASGDTSVWENDVLVTKDGINLSAGEHTLSFSVLSPGYGMISYFELANENIETNNVSIVYVDKTTLEVDETTTISGAAASSFDGTVKASSDANTVYTSTNNNVIEVNGTKITAVAPGTADITAIVGGVQAKRTITVLEERVLGDASLGVYSDIADYVTVEINGEANDDIIKSVPIGSMVTVTAKTDDPAYIFRGWKRGSEDNGVWISENATITFPMMTNTFLTALYEPVAAQEVVNVEFYNYKGQYIETAENVGTKSFGEIKPQKTPILTGYSNPFWTVDGVNELLDNATFVKLTRVVANYENTDSFDITIGAGISGAASGNYAYDTELVLHAENDGTWYIDGKPVAYGSAYLHCVWDDAAITFDEKDSSVAPIITLDSEVKENGARMISYDANGTNIAEVGIIFGNNAEITSFESKATSKKRGDSQGQFTAMPNGTETSTDARGYLIYNDNGTYRVIYAD